MRRYITTVAFLAGFLSFTTAALAQEERNEIGVQGTAFITKDTNGNGILQHVTRSGGFLLNYRFHITPWLAAEANYGYNRDTLRDLIATAPMSVNENVHQATAALVLGVPISASRVQPYVLAGAGVLRFDPRSTLIANPFGADNQTKGAFLYGGGANISLAQHVALRLEYRGLVYKAPDFALTALSTDTTTHTAMPSIGLSFRF
jgi:opacity protein-like surface antigen